MDWHHEMRRLNRLMLAELNATTPWRRRRIARLRARILTRMQDYCRGADCRRGDETCNGR